MNVCTCDDDEKVRRGKKKESLIARGMMDGWWVSSGRRRWCAIWAGPTAYHLVMDAIITITVVFYFILSDYYSFAFIVLHKQCRHTFVCSFHPEDPFACVVWGGGAAAEEDGSPICFTVAPAFNRYRNRIPYLPASSFLRDAMASTYFSFFFFYY